MTFDSISVKRKYIYETERIMTLKARKKKAESDPQKSNPDILEVRQIKPRVELMLWTLSGGRCEFCNKYLLEDWLTLTKGKYGQNAHIVGFKIGAARGSDADRPANINDVCNLMLLCYEHHKLIDLIKPLEYPSEKLQTIKRIHEESIKRLTEIKPNQTFVIRLQSKIGNDAVHIADSDIRVALEPFFYPLERQLDIDLTQFDDSANGYFNVAIEQIKSKVARLYDSQIDANPIGHFSSFTHART